MAVAHKKRKTHWDRDEERKLIEVWAEILVETNGKMVTRKTKEALATQQINLYVTKELGKTTTFNENEIRNKIDGLMKKGKNFYSLYRKKRKTGEEVDPDIEIELDFEAAQTAWPNFKIFYETFKDHPSLGPGPVEDSSNFVLDPDQVSTEAEPTNTSPGTPSTSNSSDTPATMSNSSYSTSPSWDNSSLTGDVEDFEKELDDELHDHEAQLPKKRSLAVKKTLVSVPNKKTRNSNLSQFAEIQKTTQEAMMDHEAKLQSESIAFQAKLEQDRLRFESEMSQRLQQQSQQFQQQMMQQNQLFHAELFKRLFDKQ